MHRIADISKYKVAMGLRRKKQHFQRIQDPGTLLCCDTYKESGKYKYVSTIRENTLQEADNDIRKVKSQKGYVSFFLDTTK